MDYRKLGRSDLDVSTICMGCWAIAGGRTWGPQDESDAIEALKTAVDVGVNFFDTAEAYGSGRSEQLIGRAFQDMRDEVIIATKVSSSHLRPKDLRAACEGSLKNLGTDYIDVYYIHWPNWDVPLADTVGEMRRLKEEGKIRYIGCSNFGPRDLQTVLDLHHVEVDQVAYSLLFRAVEFELRPVCIEHDVSIAPYSPLMHGILTGKFETMEGIPDGRARTRHFSSERPMTRHGGPGAPEATAEALQEIRRVCDEAGLDMAKVALAWLLRQPGVTTVIAGARNPEQIRANARAAELALPDDVVDALTAATEPLKRELGPNLDMWEPASNSRIR